MDGVEVRVDVLPALDGVQVEALAHRVVVGQPVVAAAHDVQRSCGGREGSARQL